MEILKQTEKDTKSVFGSYGSQRMKDWQEIIKLYENNAIYLAETAQIYVRNVNFEVPNIKKQMHKLEQQAEESLKRVQDLGKPEATLLQDHAALLQELGVRNSSNNLRQEFINALNILPDLYEKAIANIKHIQPAIDLYAECVVASPESAHQILPILRHLIEFGNTTVYQYIHKEEPLKIEEPELKLSLQDDEQAGAADSNDIDFGTDDNGASSTVSAEMIDFGDCNLDDASAGDIDWGIESSSNEAAVEINFDIPVEEYGIVVEGAGMDGGLAKGKLNK